MFRSRAARSAETRSFNSLIPSMLFVLQVECFFEAPLVCLFPGWRWDSLTRRHKAPLRDSRFRRAVLVMHGVLIKGDHHVGRHHVERGPRGELAEGTRAVFLPRRPFLIAGASPRRPLCARRRLDLGRSATY